MIGTARIPLTTAFYRLILFRGVQWQPARFVWINTVPKKQRLHLWLAFWNRANTNENRCRKNWTNDPCCRLCSAIETYAHITLRCRLADEVWTYLGLQEHGTGL